MKLLITGASGLLGSDIAAAAEKHPSPRISKLVKLCLNRRDGFLDADIISDEGMAKIAACEWDAAVHSAAWRDPDKCAKDEAGTYKINVEATKRLAAEAAARKAKLIYISTDYVFPGDKPPYAEDDAPSPVNWYGETKRMGEEIVLASSKDSAVLRVPLLYGVSAGLDKSALLSAGIRAVRSGRPCAMEDSIVRYPTFTGDVADAVFFILSRNLSGIFHFSGEDKTTRYRMMQIFAEVFEGATSHISRLEKPPPSEVRRPQDSHLSMKKLLSFGFPRPVGFKKRLEILKPEIEKQLNLLA